MKVLTRAFTVPRGKPDVLSEKGYAISQSLYDVIGWLGLCAPLGSADPACLWK